MYQILVFVSVWRTNLSLLPLDAAEQLSRCAPKDDEKKAFAQYEKDKKPVTVLTDEDQLMVQVNHLFILQK